MINKLLIANRGEIACRIIKTARRLGIKTVAVYSDADIHAEHVKAADEAYHIGAAPSRESYLDGDKIINVALKAGVNAIHPGYGFLSENTHFADKCEQNNIIFIGPSSDAINAMGSKSRSKELMFEANVPLVPGYYGENQDPAFLLAEAEKVGFPVLIKATYGGGGKGMRVVRDSASFNKELEGAKREALAGFGNDKVLIERYVESPRHVEVQVFADNFGNCIYLGDRDCTLQRRHQKVIEEAPAPGLSAELRKEMGEAAVRCAKKINYKGAGTVEFLLCGDEFFFMEMNTRLQVEHPVTECVVGQDLVEWQLAVASNEPLPLDQNQVAISGHAFEARIYAEEPSDDFMPSSGVLTLFDMPNEHACELSAVRIDTGVIEGSEISAFYDPMIAKLIVHGANRKVALRQLSLALEKTAISGVATNVSFLHTLANHPSFIESPTSTHFIDDHINELTQKDEQEQTLQLLMAALVYINANICQTSTSPWNTLTAFSLNESNHYTLPFIDFNLECQRNNDAMTLVYDDAHFAVNADFNGNNLTAFINGEKHTAKFVLDEQSIAIMHSGNTHQFALKSKHYVAEKQNDGNSLQAPLNGTVVKQVASVGDNLKQGDAVIIIEAMKMEYTLTAPFDGQLSQFYFAEGDLVSHGDLLAKVEEA
ncbi:Acetyl-/propionyl-coenzyme A carboxylase alpha chain [Pseudoalteromonas sp. P1-9]|uniref:acetyl/propionyl/methylcrotonyl-CoA carboxylase subunit alpha n=1 Tax=Pseudoalteromonas sp. P1-9 TaxID=1710354 RepID=UPI0006D60FD3|nr:acetyl/propionyl/methylcrotonyl-CoA carboxylase subunit alpha [Pseudoalteromonas sp. P1-9]KPV94038.1 Acetyl-/propionyl-coenzyme A carboxylase alpha chain [Pseudoalteromonas sp. P1-9]